MTHLPIEKGADVRAMFDRIAPTYDLLNGVLTLGLDERWRKLAVTALAPVPNDHILDLCAGTLDLTRHVVRREPGVRITAVDAAAQMLDEGEHKISDAASVETVVADALDLPFDSGTFDGAICGFGMRNLADLDQGLNECRRVLKPGASLVVLEFFRPTGNYERLFHQAINRTVVPLFGRLLSGDHSAYLYLAKSMETFDSVQDFVDRGKTHGFETSLHRSLFPGVASLVVLRNT